MLKIFPGFIDVHVHLRDPGATHKEDYRSGTRAALMGGFTTVLDMPNNPVPTLTVDRVEEKVALIGQKAVCAVGLHFGTDGNNLGEFAAAAKHLFIYGLKIYCNHTTGMLLLEDEAKLDQIFAAWKSDKPILVHAEGEKVVLALELAKQYGRRLHICHISQAVEVDAVRRAKKQRQMVSAGVTPHHLFLTDKDRNKLGSFADMKPPLGTTDDQLALWEGLGDTTIDIVETDHAPHTRDEKAKTPPPFGVPGLETAVGLLFRSVREGRLSEDDVVRLLYTTPKKLFSIPDQFDTFVELDPAKPFVIGKNGFASKCDWSPFEGWEAYGRVEKVVYKGKIVVENSKLLV